MENRGVGWERKKPGAHVVTDSVWYNWKGDKILLKVVCDLDKDISKQSVECATYFLHGYSNMRENDF